MVSLTIGCLFFSPNFVLSQHHMPPVAPCEGCCVKMVQFIGTDHYQVAVLKQNIPSEMEVAPRTDRYHVKDLKQKTFWGVLWYFPGQAFEATISVTHMIVWDEENHFLCVQIKITCTDNFEVNFFMVNHACMTEGHRHGHMCFCEEDECNGGQRLCESGTLLLLITSLLLRWWTINTTQTIIPQSPHCLADCLSILSKNYILSNAVIIYLISSIFFYSVVLLGIK